METKTKTEVEWSKLLVDAVNVPGTISAAYSRFWNYSSGNQLLAMWQCAIRGIELGPIHTFKGWQGLGRSVKKGSKAIELIMPVTGKNAKNITEANPDGSYRFFIPKRNWFVLSQTEGAEYVPEPLPGWDEEISLSNLGILKVNFASMNGNCQGYAFDKCLAINPVAEHPARTLFHEIAHIVLGHTKELRVADENRTPKNLMEVEAEAVSLIVAESLGLPGVEKSRGYIQGWLRGQSIPEKSAHKIFSTADKILKSGRELKKSED